MLLQIQGVVTMIWKCDSLMMTNSIVLWLTIMYLVIVQSIFLRRSVVCIVPVYLSKNIVGLAILFVCFWGNANLQVLTTFLIQNPIGTFNASFYALLGPVQVASIVGIMTGTLIQIWFMPRLVTQTWLILVISVTNWILVFSLEAFVFPYRNQNLPTSCELRTSTSCFTYSAIRRTYYLSAMISGVVVLIGIAVIWLHGHWLPDDIRVPKSHSLREYLNIPHLRVLATSLRGCCIAYKDDVLVDDGLLIMKNVLRISATCMTRLNNVQYEIIYRYLPRIAKPFFSKQVGTFLVFHVKEETGRITHRSSYKWLADVGIDDGSMAHWRAGFHF
ncbi:hypothetical protein SPRG_18158 [Saprolegnia parasitica CBS 223.65]|uniref:Uncharacterized protein n=1 Tax=Saprolegnia parasitica (strain CBS 223.65) TaxID=695850 RepID=A0A067BPQ6_SAPPC|nr:hypothetical protein SPRG_18158 [Saprolegnia parasitica CBS 223.65]KDO16311.1 hypothetical protein SPRG_18158 [Saprolegnia parasitica CBS 223.65]|eukprot:XP_012212982.1 hypothetical protein SPRG_18158 [Saprolegnia parasitica CBS 223.65]